MLIINRWCSAMFTVDTVVNSLWYIFCASASSNPLRRLASEHLLFHARSLPCPHSVSSRFPFADITGILGGTATIQIFYSLTRYSLLVRACILIGAHLHLFHSAGGASLLGRTGFARYACLYSVITLSLTAVIFTFCIWLFDGTLGMDATSVLAHPETQGCVFDSPDADPVRCQGLHHEKATFTALRSLEFEYAPSDLFVRYAWGGLPVAGRMGGIFNEGGVVESTDMGQSGAGDRAVDGAGKARSKG